MTLVYNPIIAPHTEPIPRQKPPDVRVEDDRREDEEVSDVRRAHPYEDPVRSGAQHRET